MADTLPPPTLSPGVKRTHDGIPVESSSFEVTPRPTLHSSVREPSPVPSNSDSSLSELTSATPQPIPDADATAVPTKKRKLTYAEREVEKGVRRTIKEEKEKFKAEEKARKDEERRRKAEEKETTKRLKEMERAQKDVEKAHKDAEKAQKDAEKAQKKKAAEEVKAARTAEKAKQEAEKLKKEKSQMRLGAFFGRPALASTPPTTPDNVSVGMSSRRSSVASIEMEKPEDDMAAVTPRTDFDEWILPFFVQEHMELAPVNRYLCSNDKSVSCPSWLDHTHPIDSNAPRLLFKSRRRRPRKTLSIKDLVARNIGSLNLSKNVTSDSTDIVAAIKRARFKTLEFKEDARPSYQGTYTRVVSPRTSRKLSRVPTYRGLPDTDYDYDSEAEWQEPDADDEDLEDEENLSEEEDGADDMDDFLDDEADVGKRAISSTDVEPVSTGLCWEGSSNLVVASLDLRDYRMQVMHDDQVLPIDPHSTDHWFSPSTAGKKVAEAVNTAAMQPPRLPLSNVSVNTSPLKSFLLKDGKQSEVVTSPNTVPRPADPEKPIKLIPNELLPAFKTAVQGSDLNKIALVEILKKQFPKCSKPSIKDTLTVIARREGTKEADKRWVLIN